MSQRILSIHEAPFDSAAGVICSADEGILEKWRQYRLAVWHRSFSEDILGFLQKKSVVEVLYAFSNVSYDVVLEPDAVRLKYLKSQFDSHSESLRKKTSFLDLFEGDKDGKPFMREIEAQARRAGRLLGQPLRTRIITKISQGDPQLHIDAWPALAIMCGKINTVVAHPKSVVIPQIKYDLSDTPYFDWPDRNQMRRLEQGDVCMLAEIPHGPDEGDFHFETYRDGPWIGFYSFMTRNKIFEDASVV